MKKKCIGLSILLLVLLLGLSTNCYALSIRDYTVFERMMSDVENVYPDNNVLGHYFDRFNKLKESTAWQQYRLEIPFSSYSNCIVRNYSVDNNTAGIDIFLFNQNYDLNVLQNGVVQTTTTFDIPYEIRFNCPYNTNFQNWTFSRQLDAWTWGSTYAEFQSQPNENKSCVFLVSNTFNNPYNKTIYGIFEDYPTIRFEEVPTTEHIAVNGINQVPLYYAGSSYLNFANLVNPTGDQLNGTMLIGDVLSYVYWDNVSSKWVLSGPYFDRDLSNTAYQSNRYLNVVRNSNFTNYSLSVKQPYLYTNVMYIYTIYYRDYDEPSNVAHELNYRFYVANSDTVITNGTIDTTVSFPDYPSYIGQWGNLSTDQNNNNNTDLIIANINSGDNLINNTILDDSQVIGQLNDFVSGDIDNIGQKLGFQNLSNPYSIVIYGFISDVCSALTSTGNVSFNYSMHGESPTTINSDDIYLPNGVLKTFISMVLVFITIYFIYYRFKVLVDDLTSGDSKSTIESLDVDLNYFYM